MGMYYYVIASDESLPMSLSTNMILLLPLIACVNCWFAKLKSPLAAIKLPANTIFYHLRKARHHV